MFTVVIVGGDAAGMSAASKIKRELQDAHVIVFEQSETISYSACGMPYWIAGIVENEDDLIVMTAETARAKRGLDVRIQHRVTAIDREAKTVAGVDLETDRPFTQAYDKLVIATGARAVKPPIDGMELPGVFTLRAFDDARRIHRFINEYDPGHAVVIGGGYIGVEMAEALRERDMEVHIVEMLPQLLPNFDADVVDYVMDHIQRPGSPTPSQHGIVGNRAERGKAAGPPGRTDRRWRPRWSSSR